MLVSTLIQEAYEDLAVVQPGETISTSLQTTGFARLNELLQSLSTEGATVFGQVVGSFAVAIGTANYTLGAGGSWNSTVRAQKITAWKINTAAFVSGGPPLPFDQFDAAARAAQVAFTQAQQAAISMAADTQAKIIASMAQFYQTPGFTLTPPALASISVPMVLGADTSWPLINVRVWPTPTQNATAEIAYWVPIVAFGAVGDTVNFPPGWEAMVRSNLAVVLYPMFERVGGMPPALAANAQNTKAAIVNQNSISPAPQAAA